jgi:hypothetical protein
MTLEDFVADLCADGCSRASLGIQEMPDGYALLLDADQMYYFWVCDDGRNSVIHWDKWAIYRGACNDARRKDQSRCEAQAQ